MKFRGKIVDILCIKKFSPYDTASKVVYGDTNNYFYYRLLKLLEIVHLIARLAKLCVIKITPTHLYFIVSEVGGINGSNPSLWAELEQGHYFNEFIMEGVSTENNEIFFELVPDKLARTLSSLKTSQSTRSVKIKLTKKHSPCLTFEVELASLSAHSRLVVHDVPVTLIPRRLWHIYQEPQMPSFEISVYLPPLKQLRHLFDRLKSLSNLTTLSANRKGSFIVSISTDDVDVSTYFRNLSMPNWDRNKNAEVDNEEEFFSTTVDVKKLYQFLQGDQVNPTNVICNIADGRIMHLFLLHDDVTLQYFLPAINIG